MANQTAKLTSDVDTRLDTAERRLLTGMPLHAITSVHGEADLLDGWSLRSSSSRRRPRPSPGRASGGIPAALRHFVLTHDAEKGTGTPMLMARSGHISVRSLAKYARVSAEALAYHQAKHDPARR